MPSEPLRTVPPPIDIPALLRARLAPSLTAWMDWLCPQIDEAMLEEIAAADYGYRFDDYLTMLRRLRDSRHIPEHLDALPLEVLELVRWSEPDDPTWTPGRPGRRGHLMRLFCCALLLAVADNAQLRRYFDEEPTLRQLVASTITLGEAAIEALLPLLCWRLPTLAAAEYDRPFFALGVLLLAAAHYRDEGAGPLLYQLCRWVIDEEASARAARPPTLLWEGWLLGLKFSATGDDRWRELAWHLLIDPPTPAPEGAAEAMRDIGARLVLGEPDAAPAPGDD